MFFNLLLGELALGLIVLNTQHVVSGRNVREKCYDNQPKADHVEALRLTGFFYPANEGSVANASQGEEPEEQPY